MTTLHRRGGTLIRLLLAVVLLSSVVTIGLSQTLADWWSGADSGNAVLDGPVGGVRALNSVLESGVLNDGLGVHVVMWCVVALALNTVVRSALSPATLPLSAGAMAAMGIVLELMQDVWTLRDASVRDIFGNLMGVGLASMWVTRSAWRTSTSHGSNHIGV